MKQLSVSRRERSPLLGLTRDGHKGSEFTDLERGSIAPHAGLIFERVGEGRREERTFLAEILPDRCFDVAALTLVPGFGVAESLSDIDRSTAANDLRLSVSIDYDKVCEVGQ